MSSQRSIFKRSAHSTQPTQPTHHPQIYSLEGFAISFHGCTSWFQADSTHHRVRQSTWFVNFNVCAQFQEYRLGPKQLSHVLYLDIVVGQRPCCRLGAKGEQKFLAVRAFDGALLPSLLVSFFRFVTICSLVPWRGCPMSWVCLAQGV